MANQIQATVYQIDGNPQREPIIVSFLTSNILIKEATISTIPSVNSAIVCYQNVSNQLQEQTFYASESIANLVTAANVGNASQVQTTVLQINGDPQNTGVQYSFPANSITIWEVLNSTSGVNSLVVFKNKQYSVSETEASLLSAANVTSAGAQGPQGIQGPAGPQGVAGPVGPAGLTWRASWSSGTSYVANDAVGYGGASYFCILATSGTTAPNVDTTHWALLASQGATGATGATGAQGPTGPQGPQGPQGPSGSSPFNFEILGVDGTNNSNATPITKIYTSTYLQSGNYVKLPSSPTIGDTYYISNIDSNLDLRISSGSNLIFLAGSSTNGSPFVAGTETNKIYVFQYTNTGIWTTWSLSSSRGYKVYTAIASWGAGGLTTTVLENTLGFTISWANVLGTMTGTASSAIFTNNKTVFITGSYFSGTNSYNNVCKRINDTTLNLFSIKTSDGSSESAFGQTFTLEIRVYN